MHTLTVSKQQLRLIHPYLNEHDVILFSLYIECFRILVPEDANTLSAFTQRQRSIENCHRCNGFSEKKKTNLDYYFSEKNTSSFKRKKIEKGKIDA